MQSVSPSVVAVNPMQMERFLATVKLLRDLGGDPLEEEQLEALRSLLVDASLGQAWLVELGLGNIGYAVASFMQDIEAGGRIALVTNIQVLAEYASVELFRLIIAGIERDLSAYAIKAVGTALFEPQKELMQVFAEQGFLTDCGFFTKKTISSNWKIPGL
ncbi:hypothetical protein E1162_15400 [Rhodobacteraceae bacterium RKSG542]|uniref:hypothetical protein n=1 Tax=Pseudovibrio flavus TaxID=2529854 RepID=UPI0012BC144B|nr:hypothetical protein [Pseudovibrio flavus]MTI18629.1 hypothetical protein [Pseudovibrio flavus]